MALATDDTIQVLVLADNKPAPEPLQTKVSNALRVTKPQWVKFMSESIKYDSPFPGL